MRHIEADMETRVRRGGLLEDRKTRNLVYAEFTHFTARPVDGIVDPNLHIHAYTFNTTYFEEEGRFKAAKFLRIKQNAPLHQAIFHSLLAAEMKKLGYQIRNQRLGFEVAGISRELIQAFSRRTAQIEQLADELGISGNKKAMSELGANSREGKERIKNPKEMKLEWSQRAKQLENELRVETESGSRIEADEAVSMAVATSFERRSTIPYRRLVAEALQMSLGSCNLEEIREAFSKRVDLVLAEGEKGLMATTVGVAKEESEILAFLENTRGTMMAMNRGYKASESELDNDQKAAVESLMRCQDRVFVIQGRAGTGKTTMMKEAVRAIEKSGERVFTYAPTSEAAHVVLKEEGFSRSETIQQFLVNPRLQEEARHGVLWIDEAGLLSVGDLNKLFQIAETCGNRLILSGDTRQHSSIERGDALFEVVESGLVSFEETRQIYRQKSEKYRLAIEHLSRGETKEGFFLLDDMEAIHEYRDFAEKLDMLASDYIESTKKFGSVLLVSPTHFEGRLVTQKIRQTLKQTGKAGEDELIVPVDRNRHLTTAEKQLPYYYEEGQVVHFQKAVSGKFRRQEKLSVECVSAEEVSVRREDGEVVTLDLQLACNFEVLSRDKLSLSKGDTVRLLGNFKTEQGKRLFNGSTHQVEGWNSSQDILLKGGHLIPYSAAILDYGYVSTSHGSQGRTTGKVIICQGTQSQGASSLEQFYVSASRGRFEVSIYTDNKANLLEDVGVSGQRQSARELLQKSEAELLEKESLRFTQDFWEETAALEV
jgi:ATP-dependent exoDNAse (exonuclease V) alpha subunit